MSFIKSQSVFTEIKRALGHAMGKEFRASLAVLDEGFAKGILKNIQEMETSTDREHDCIKEVVEYDENQST